MRWIALCLASLAVATCLCGATAMARPISPVGPAPTATTNETQATQASKAHRPSAHAPQTSRAGVAKSVLLGYDAVQPARASTPPGRAESFRFTDRRSGSVSSIHVFVDSRNRAKSLIAGLYSNANGHPGSLLTVGALNHPKAGAWNALRVTSASVRSGHTYWLAVLGRGGRLYFRASRNGRCSAAKARQPRIHSLRSSWTGRPDHSLCRISAYATRKGTKGTVNGVLSPVAGGGSNGGSGPGLPTPLLSCDLNATTSNFTAQIAAATPGEVVCLASGDYSGFMGTSKSAPGITITSEPGAAVTFNSGMHLNPSTVQNFTLDGTGGGGTMTVGGELDIVTTGGAVSKALNLTFQNLAFPARDGNVVVDGPENSNITFNRDTFVDANAACSGGSAAGYSGIFYVDNAGSATTQTGLTVENSIFVSPSDLWNPGRVVQDGAPMVFKNNVITGFTDHTESASCNHIDGLQLYSGTNGSTGSVTFTGNLCYDDYGCIMGFDGTSDNTITDNVCFDMETSCVSLYADTGSVVSHNTQQTGGADPGGCNTMNDTSAPIQSCGNSELLITSSKSGDRASSGETYSNNASQSGPSLESGSVATNTNNMWSGASSPNINGTATFVGGAHPTTWAGFELTSGSAGHGRGSDGLDVGIRGSAGGPPTGGGSAPVNTAAPALSGLNVQGQTLSTTNGTWTITGYVPTVTTYQWFDCTSSAFSASSCTPIQPQTAPTSANGPTYTLQASDIGKYVFSEVTVTNANGQVNAVSNAAGPVA
jgi:hypothetical protein